MKQQKILALLPNEESNLTIKAIQSVIQKINSEEQKLLTLEAVLAIDIFNLIKSTEQYETFKNLLSLQVENYPKDEKVLFDKTLLEQISSQIAKSMFHYSNVDENCRAGTIDYGQETYIVSHSDMWRIFAKETINLQAQFNGLNDFLRQFDITIFFPGEVETHPDFSNWPVPIQIRIFGP